MKLSHISSKKRGFTLIELLIVIGILGILAAGLLAAIDPLEQLKRGRDTSRRNIAVEVNNAMLRYYAVQGSMPWGNTATSVDLTAAGGSGVVNTLITAGELKTTFNQGMNSLAGRPMWVEGEASGLAVAVCFDPESKSISNDPSTIFVSSANGTVGTTTQAVCATTNCWFCVK